MNQTTLTDKTVISTMSKAVKAVIATVEEENNALKAGQVTTIAPMVEKKIIAIEQFNKAQQLMEQYFDAGGTLAAHPTLGELQNLFVKMKQVNRENEIWIQSNLEVSKLMAEIYKANQQEETLRQFGYNKNGKVNANDKKSIATAAIGLDDKV